MSADEYNRRVKQFDLIKKVCNELEKEDEADSDEVKAQILKNVMRLMQEVGHEYLINNS